MIAFKNHGESECLDLGFNSATAGAKFNILFPFACVLKAIYASIGQAGTTGTMEVDLQKVPAAGGAAVSIFSTAQKLETATGTTTVAYGALTTNPTTFVKGDQLVINVTTAHTTPATNYGLSLLFARPHGTKIPAATITGGFGADNE